MAERKYLIHIKSNQTDTTDAKKPKLPTSGQIEHGEIAINYLKDKETISIKNSANEIVSFNKEICVGKTNKDGTVPASVDAKLPEIFIDESTDPLGVQVYSKEQIDLSLNAIKTELKEHKVSDTAHEDIRAMIQQIEEDRPWYGIEWDTEVSSPLCTRIGNLTFHRTLPIQSNMRGCLLDDNGNVVKYLNSNDWTSEVRDGSQGQVMVEIAEHYRKFETEGTKRRCKLSPYPLIGFHKVPKCYISAYEASIERSSNKLCSVVNMDTNYRGGNNNTAWDGTYRSLLGRPVTSKNRTQFRAAARLRNENATAEWNCLDYNIYKAVFWLYYVEYANRNCQTAFTAEKDSNGYMQGGLGNGVTNISDWSGFNSANPFIPCGSTDTLGNNSGIVTYAVQNADGGAYYNAPVPRYRGIENPFGHIWKWCDGINIKISSNNDGGRSEIYVCNDPSKYNDTNYESYLMRGLEARTNGYTKSIIFGEFGDIIASSIGAGSPTYWCDYHYTNIPASGSALRGVLLGGDANYGAAAGFAYACSSDAPAYASATIGSRLCFLPS